jgi:pyruvate dehydrogenase E1 component
MPEGCREGILKGMYKLRASGDLPPERAKEPADPEGTRAGERRKAHLMASGAIVNEALEAQRMLSGTYGVPADVWSVTSYKEIYRDAVETERYNMLHPDEPPRAPYIGRLLSNERGVFVAVSDYMKILPNSIARWLPGRLLSLGTDGFGRSDSRAELRRFFEVDARHIAFAALYALSQEDLIEKGVVARATKELGIDPDKPSPWFS